MISIFFFTFFFKNILNLFCFFFIQDSAVQADDEYGCVIPAAFSENRLPSQRFHHVFEILLHVGLAFHSVSNEVNNFLTGILIEEAI